MNDYKDKTICFIDLETTGLSYNADRIIEVAAVKVKNGEIVDEFVSTVNPGFNPDQYILKLTNIDLDEINNAKPFEEIATSLKEFIGDDLVVAHNARFDYSFLKTEFGRLDIEFKNTYCCSVKLSRLLYPHYRKHGLSYIIERFNIPEGDRHRAAYDTHAVRIMFYESLKSFGEEKFWNAVKSVIKTATLPSNLVKFKFKKISEGPGVYIYLGENNYPLYVGMSKNLKNRIMQHMYNDINYVKDFKISQQVKDIKFIETKGILGAQIRESYLVKYLMPMYNSQLRRNNSPVKLVKYLDEDGYINTKIMRDGEIKITDLDNIVGIFDSPLTLKAILNSYVKKFGLCPKLLGLEKKGGVCFSSQLGQCYGACVHKITPEQYNNIFTKVFENIKLTSWPFKSAVIINERTDDGEEKMLFYNWTYLGSNLEMGEVVDLDKFTFNLDTYKIVKNYLNNVNEVEEFDLKNNDFSNFKSFEYKNLLL